MSTPAISPPVNREQVIFAVQDRWDRAAGKPTAKERRALLEQHREDQLRREKLVDQGLARELQHHYLATRLLLSFAFLAIFSWTVTCVLCYRPINVPSYYDQVRTVTKTQWDNNDRWRKAANVISTIVGSISIPVTSAICAKAAAVHCQRRSDGKPPPLSLRQTLALADKGWSDFGVLRSLLTPKTTHQTRSPLLLVSIGLVGLALLIPALQSAYTDTVHIRVSSWDDVVTRVGIQNTPGTLASMRSTQIIDSVTSALVEGKLSDKQPYLWLSGVDSMNITSIATNLAQNHTAFERLPAILFTATFPVGTDTGVIRQLALRLNSSITCEIVDHSAFPSSCPGPNPFDQTYSNIGNDSGSTPLVSSATNTPKFRTRICAPGDMTASSWQGVGYRQDVFEEVWLDVQYTPALDPTGSNFTQHCYGNTTLGYFELPNYWNGHTAGDLFDEYPANGPNVSYYDIDEVLPENGLPDKLSPGIKGSLLTSVNAIFGNNTFFNTVASYSTQSTPDDPLCRQLRQPFTGLYDDDVSPDASSPPTPIGDIWWNQTSQSSPGLDCDAGSDANVHGIFLSALFQWLPNFRDPIKATAALTLANYYSKNAILNFVPDYSAFPLSSDAGLDTQKFVIPLPAMIIITILLAIQLAGLALLAHYASRHPTWTESLDSFAILRLGASIAEDVPLLSALQVKEAKMLDEKAGWIGDTGTEGEIRQLALGGSERVRESDLYRLRLDREEDA